MKLRCLPSLRFVRIGLVVAKRLKYFFSPTQDMNYTTERYTVASTGAAVTHESAMKVLYEVCRSFKETESYGLMPSFVCETYVEDNGKVTYSCRLTLPRFFGVSEVSGVFTMAVMPCRKASHLLHPF